VGTWSAPGLREALVPRAVEPADLAPVAVAVASLPLPLPVRAPRVAASPEGTRSEPALREGPLPRPTNPVCEVVPRPACAERALVAAPVPAAAPRPT
jgi:hypothetical protein